MRRSQDLRRKRLGRVQKGDDDVMTIKTVQLSYNLSERAGKNVVIYDKSVPIR